MKNFGAKWLAVAAVIGAAAGLTLNGCSDGGGGGTGKGGTTGSAGRGGTTGQGGGGTTGQAGRGGTTGQGGGGTTGQAGRGGTTGSGGGGTTGGGGAGGGLPCPGLGTFESATDMMGFALNTFMDGTAGAAVNLAVREAGARATISIDTADGDPSPGSIKVDAPFDAYKQFIDVQRNYGSTMLKDWRGAKLHVKLKVMGGNPSSMNPMGVQPYVNTGTGYSYCGKYFNLIAGNGWNDYVLDLSMCPSTADPSMVIAFGINLATGDGSNGDGGTNTMLPAAATVHVDSFWLEYGTNACTPGTGGTGGGTGGATGGTGGATGGTGGTGGATGGAGGRGGAGGGGTTGTGGGGTTGTGGGGTTGTAGTGGNVDGGTAALTVSNFDTTVDGFGLNTFGSREGGNLAVQPDGGGATIAMAAWDGTEGMGTPVGSVKVTAPFSGYNQFFELAKNFGSTLQDWTGKTTFKVRFKVTAGLNPDPSYPAGAQAFVLTTTGYVSVYGYNNVVAGTDWQVASVTLPAAPPPTGWNLAQVIQVGLKITSNAGNNGDGGTASGPPTAATIFIDSVWVE